MKVRVSYSQEYLRVRGQLDSLARRALEEVEDAIAEQPDLKPHRQQIGDAIIDYHGLQGDLIVRYRRVQEDLVELEALLDLRNPML